MFCRMRNWINLTKCAGCGKTFLNFRVPRFIGALIEAKPVVDA